MKQVEELNEAINRIYVFTDSEKCVYEDGMCITHGWNTNINGNCPNDIAGRMIKSEKDRG